MDKYVILVDIDGAIAEVGARNIKQCIIDEIERLKQNGHILVVASGRTYNNIKCIKGMESFNYIGSMFGNIIFDKNGNYVVTGKPMNKADVCKIAEFSEKSGESFIYKTMFVDKTFGNDERIRAFNNAIKVSREEFEKDLENNAVFQMLCVGQFPENVKEEFKNLEFYQMPGGYFDIIPKENTKKNIVKYFKEKFPGYKTIAIGDSENDLAAFENSDISIAMGNSSDEIKAAATYVTKSLSEDGFVYAFKEMLKL